MHGWLKLTWVETKLFLREPIAVFFSLAYTAVLILVFGSMFGNEPTSLFGVHGAVDVSVPAFMAVVIAFNALITLANTLTGYREKGVLRRLQATPTRPEAILMAQIIVSFLMTALGILFMIVMGKVVFNLHFFGDPLSMLAGFVLATLSMFALAFIVASLAPTVRIATMVGAIIFILMVFLSGASFPSQIFPPALKQIAGFLPLTYVVTLLQGLWLGEAWGAHITEVLVLAAVLVVGVVVSARLFRWK